MDQQCQPLRHRKQVRRADYIPLEDDSDAESFRRSSSNSSLHHINRERKQLLCDKCWVKQERTRATKRCADCDKNLCNSCATRDEIKRPWWIPACIVQCLRFMFNDVFTPHSIVDLYPEEERHWTQSQEASHVHQIPRVRTRTSLSSNESISENRRSRSSSLSDGRKKGKETKGHQDKTRKLKHSNSYEDKSKRRKSDDKRLSRNWSSEALVQRYKHDDIDRLRRYKDNWCSFDETYQQQEKNQSSDVDDKQHFRNKVKGKDIIIVLTDKDAKVVVNDDALPDCHDSSPSKRKSRRKSKPDITKNYTEEIFEEVPIYFKRDAKRSGRAETQKTTTTDKTHGYDQYKTTKDTFNQQAKYAQQRNSSNTDNTSTSQHAYTNYLVEEPPDPCNICLDDLPGDEARTLACYHTFHTKCLLHLLSKSESMDFGITCPVCSHLTPVRNYYAKKNQWVRELPVNTTV